MRLPPLNALRAFEAAARHEGYIAAAQELHVTRGAISRQVKLLEDHLGTHLFTRHAQGVRLTAAGRRLLPVLTEAFESITRTTARLAQDAADLHVICPPATSIRWLIPRLQDFHQRHPGIRLRLTTDFHSQAGFGNDYDIGFSVADWPGRPPDVEVLPLFPVLLTPACAPGYLEAKGPFTAPEDLVHAELLHETPRRTDWTDWCNWFKPNGVDPGTGQHFPNLDMAVKAAVMGAGMVMADLALCQDELASGTLVTPFPQLTIASSYGDICILGAREHWHSPKVEAFRSWAFEAAAELRDALACHVKD